MNFSPAWLSVYLSSGLSVIIWGWALAHLPKCHRFTGSEWSEVESLPPRWSSMPESVLRFSHCILVEIRGPDIDKSSLYIPHSSHTERGKPPSGTLAENSLRTPCVLSHISPGCALVEVTPRSRFLSARRSVLVWFLFCALIRKQSE